MNEITEDAVKRRAIEVHSLQAGEFAASYESMKSDAYATCFNYSRKRLETLLLRYLPERGDGLSLLDAGCGTGHYLARLRERGFQISGMDGSADMIDIARQNNPSADIRLGDVEEIPFPGGQFDIVICIEVLRYLANPQRCINELARVLKPGGLCLATAAPLLNSNGYWIINRIAATMPIGSLVRLKQYFITAGRLRRDFFRSGFVSPEIHGVYTGPINWIEHAAPRALPGFLRKWEGLDSKLADRPVLRNFSNMFLVSARKSKERELTGERGGTD